MIKFIGKRIPGAQVHSHAPATPAVSAAPASGATSANKSLSSGATVEYADFPAQRWSRLLISV
jgi:hypothetical protein